jgi:hypothetical protein
LTCSQSSALFWVWSWDPLRFMRRHPPHHLSPAPVNHQAGQDPEARLSRPKSPQQRSDQARMPVNSEQDSCSFPVIVFTQKRSIVGKFARLSFTPGTDVARGEQADDDESCSKGPAVDRHDDDCQDTH